jgi:hypothetical protein
VAAVLFEPAGGARCQRPRVTESVSADFDRPIRTEIDGAGLSSPLRQGLDETLALAAGDGGLRGRLGGCRAAAVSLKSSPRPKLAEGGARGWCMAVLVRVVLGFRR